MQELLDDIKAYREFQKEKKKLDAKMKKLQDKIRSQTLSNKTTKIGRYSVYWGIGTATIVNISRLKTYLTERQLEAVSNKSTRNNFKVGY